MFRWFSYFIKRIDVFGIIGVELREPRSEITGPSDDGKGTVRASGTAENAVRQDPRVAHLFNDVRLKGAAEAALAFHVHGTDCPVKSWRKSSTWQQVLTVANEIG